MATDLPSGTDPLDEEGVTIDAILRGRLRIIQKKSGYRFSIDALLLADFVILKEGEECIDLGTGSGIIALILACRRHRGRILGIDIQEKLVVMARRTVELNGLTGCVDIRLGDIRHPDSCFTSASFDVAVFNPPYRRLRSGRTNSDPEKAVARHEVEGTAGDFLAAAANSLKAGGRAYAIYPATRMVEMFSLMRTARVEPKRLRVVHSRPGGVGEFILVEGVKGGREEMIVLPPLTIYDEGSGYSAEMETIFRDLAVFPAAGVDRSPAS
jgi:tRNA1Val (adenine37-N6)-methyltransferase